jgi:hypothetical protein
MKILLCMLSDQHVPNLLSVHHYHPDRIMLVESTAMLKKKAADHFLNALKLGGLDYVERCDVEPLDSEDNLEAVRSVLKRVYGKYPSSTWIANVTGGTKPMSIAAHEFFKAVGGKVVYTNISRPSTFLSLDSGMEETFNYKLSIGEFLTGYGFELRKSSENIRKAEDRAGKWRNCACVIARQGSSQDLMNLSDEERKKARKQGWNIESGQLKISEETVVTALKETFNLEIDGTGSLCGRVNKHAAEFLTGGWLEVFFWDLLFRHGEALGIWDVRLGLEVGRCDDSTGCDFDVAFMRNYGLSMVECKSGAQEHDEGGDILYKVEAVIRQVRALRVKSYLATTGKNIYESDDRIKSSIHNRANIYQCNIITASDIKRLAENMENAEEIKELFF